VKEESLPVVLGTPNLELRRKRRAQKTGRRGGSSPEGGGEEKNQLSGHFSGKQIKNKKVILGTGALRQERVLGVVWGVLVGYGGAPQNLSSAISRVSCRGVTPSQAL